MTKIRLHVDVDEVDPIAGRLAVGHVEVEFTGWLDFLRVVSDAVVPRARQDDGPPGTPSAMDPPR